MHSGLDRQLYITYRACSLLKLLYVSNCLSLSTRRIISSGNMLSSNNSKMTDSWKCISLLFFSLTKIILCYQIWLKCSRCHWIEIRVSENVRITYILFAWWSFDFTGIKLISALLNSFSLLPCLNCIITPYPQFTSAVHVFHIFPPILLCLSLPTALGRLLPHVHFKHIISMIKILHWHFHVIKQPFAASYII